MAHFAKLDENNIVLEVQVFSQEDVDANGGDYAAGAETWVENWSGHNNWKQCSYNKNHRGTYPGVGCTYNAAEDRFEGPKYFDSWTLNTETCQYEPPIPRPSSIHGNIYVASAWDEANQRWNGKSEDQDYIWNTETNTWEEA